VSLCKVRVATDLELMGLLSEMEAANGFRAVGYATFAEYAAAVLHMPARQARDFVRVARSLPKLPGLKQAMADGRVGWTKAREIVRVASPDTVDAWVARAEQASSRELEALVAAASPGDAPPVEAPKGPRVHVAGVSPPRSQRRRGPRRAAGVLEGLGRGRRAWVEARLRDRGGLHVEMAPARQ
jgi:hypothetical protein